MLKFINISFLFVIVFLLLNNPLSAQNVSRRYNDIYVFYYEPNDSQLVLKTIDKINDKLLGIEKFFEGRSRFDIHIFLTKSEKEFQSYSQTGFPEWAQAIAFVKKNTIIIRTKNADEINRMPQVLLHELVHIYLGVISPDENIPTWLHEGISQYLSYESLSMDEQIYISNALYSGNITSLTNLDSMFNYTRNQAQLGYALSRSAVDYFLKKYDLQTLFKAIKKVNSTRSINRAFLETTGRDFIDFETSWFSYIDKEYKWMFVLNADNLIWLTLVVLFLLAFLRIKFKNKKTIKSWENDFWSDSHSLERDKP